MIPNASLKVINLVMMETGSYNPVYRRPYVSSMDGIVVDNLVNRVSQSSITDITEEVFSGLGIGAIAPSAVAGQEILLPNGWSEKRIRFLLTVQGFSPTGSIVYYYLQGYTDHKGVSLSGHIDPNMTMYVNSFAIVGSKMIAGANGMEESFTVLESGQIINGDLIYNEYNHDMVLMRPHEVFTGIETSYARNTMATMGSTDTHMDTRLILKDDINSSRSNNIPNNYLTNIVKEYKTNIDMTAMGSSDTDIYNRCRNSTLEPFISENMLLRSLASIRGYGSGSVFTMNELELLDPEVSKVTNYLSTGETSQVLHTSGQTEYWTGADYNTTAATILSNAVPAILMELMLGRIHFRATNMDSGGNIGVIVIDAGGLTQAPLINNIEMFKHRLIVEVLRDISYNNQETFTLDLQCDIYGETRMRISIGNCPEVEFATPSFCDSIMAPIITSDINNFNNLVGDLEQVINRSVDAMTPTGY